jgi:uncharacterized membrane protein YesL
MKKLFDFDNPVIAFLSRLADLIGLNILFLICCLPIVTIGAAWTALYYVTVKMVRKEESYIWKDFFKSFRENFKQATQIWLINLLVIAIFAADMLINRRYPDMLPVYVIVAVVACMFFTVSVMVYIYPMLSHFENTIGRTVKNSAMLAIINLPQTILFVILFALPFFSLAWGEISFRLFPIILLLGFSGPAYIASLEWSKIFKKLEPADEEADVDVIDAEDQGNRDEQEEEEQRI